LEDMNAVEQRDLFLAVVFIQDSALALVFFRC
jgi:hypothetical protein